MAGAPAASVVVAGSAADVPRLLAAEIRKCASAAVTSRGAFSVALSGGSLPSQLAALLVDDPNNDEHEAHFDKWHVLLADERIVPTSHPDSNLGSLQQHFLGSVPIPPSQIYGLDPDLVEGGSADDVARHYENVVRTVLDRHTGGQLDLAVLGLGPDGHTCSLFPGHVLLDEVNRWVAPIEDSPKPPPRRVTLTYPVLNHQTRAALFCGTGPSKAPILRSVFASLSPVSSSSAAAEPAGNAATERCVARLTQPPPYPCARVLPGGSGAAVTWIVDQDAIDGVPRESLPSG